MVQDACSTHVCRGFEEHWSAPPDAYTESRSFGRPDRRHPVPRSNTHVGFQIHQLRHEEFKGLGTS